MTWPPYESIDDKKEFIVSGFNYKCNTKDRKRVLGAETNRPKGMKMWEKRPYSRVLSWGREFKNVLAYIERNALEGAKKIPYVSRNLKTAPRLRARILESLTRQPLLQI